MDKKEIKKLDLLVTEALDMAPEMIEKFVGKEAQLEKDPVWCLYCCGIESAISLLQQTDFSAEHVFDEKNARNVAMGFILRYEMDKMRVVDKFKDTVKDIIDETKTELKEGLKKEKSDEAFDKLKGGLQ